MRAKRILVVGGVCVLGLAVVHLSTLATEEQAVTPARATTPAATARPVVAGSPRSEVRFAAPIPAAPNTAPAPGDGPVRDRAALARVEQDLAERLRGERPDPSWAPATERAIEMAIASPTFTGIKLDAVTCGATMCRLAITAGDQIADVDGKLEELTTAQPLRAGGFLRMTGPRSATMFVTRAGHKLPPAPRG